MKGYQDHQELLFPRHTFDHANGFASATKYPVYNASGHIPSANRMASKWIICVLIRMSYVSGTCYYSFTTLRDNIICLEQLNAARGRLKTILHRGLYRPIDELLRLATCGSKADVLYGYEEALTETGAWPLETAYLRQSINDILSKLDDFTDPTVSISLECTCSHCRFGFCDVVSKAVFDTRAYFDGLRLGKSA